MHACNLVGAYNLSISALRSGSVVHEIRMPVPITWLHEWYIQRNLSIRTLRQLTRHFWPFCCNIKDFLFLLKLQFLNLKDLLGEVHLSTSAGMI